MSQPQSPTPNSRPSLFRWTLLATTILHLLIFSGSLAGLALNTGAVQNKFKDIALQQFSGYLAWVNIDLLRAYGIVTVALTLVLYPLLRWWLRKHAAPSRKRMFWWAFLFAFLAWLVCCVRFVYVRPFYFTILPSIQEPVHQWISATPEWLKWTLIKLTPALVFGLVAWYWASRLVRWKARQWPTGACASVGGLLVLLGTGAYFGHEAYAQRVDLNKPRPKLPNIVILASDSLRADHLSCNGYYRKTSPAIDALAEQSYNFTQCYTPIASTLESITSMMTGQYPHTHGLQHMFPNRQQVEKVGKNSPTLAEELRKLGYDTSVCGDWCAGVYDILPLGFEHKDVSTYDNFKVYITQTVYIAHPVVPLFFDNALGHAMFPKIRSCAMIVSPEVVTERLKDRIAEKARGEKPFFIKAFYSCSHLPYSVNPPFSTKFTDPNYKGPHRGEVKFDVDAFIGSNDSNSQWQSNNPADKAQIIDLYDGCIAKFDSIVQEVLDHLKHTGQWDNTIIVITSDHGDDLFEPNTSLGHGLTFNGGDQSNHIPFILHVPGHQKAARKINQIVRTIDFAPTLLSLVGGQPDARMDGRDLTPCLTDPSKDLSLAFFGETSYLFCKRTIPGEEPLYIPPMDSTTMVDPTFDFHFVLKDAYQDDVLMTKERCLRTPNWKLVWTPGQHHDIWRLFDLRRDPHCENPVQNPEVFAAMAPKLLQWMREKRECTLKDIFPEGEPASVTAARN